MARSDFPKVAVLFHYWIHVTEIHLKTNEPIIDSCGTPHEIIVYFLY